VLSKSCKDGDEWKDTDQLGTGDLLNAVSLERSEHFILISRIKTPARTPGFLPIWI
jgi:hypothetical protein